MYSIVSIKPHHWLGTSAVHELKSFSHFAPLALINLWHPVALYARSTLPSSRRVYPSPHTHPAPPPLTPTLLPLPSHPPCSPSLTPTLLPPCSPSPHTQLGVSNVSLILISHHLPTVGLEFFRVSGRHEFLVQLQLDRL